MISYDILGRFTSGGATGTILSGLEKPAHVRKLRRPRSHSWHGNLWAKVILLLILKTLCYKESYSNSTGAYITSNTKGLSFDIHSIQVPQTDLEIILVFIGNYFMPLHEVRPAVSRA